MPPAATKPEEAWTLEEIRAGRPLISAATQDKFVPQMVNFEALGAVSFRRAATRPGDRGARPVPRRSQAPHGAGSGSGRHGAQAGTGIQRRRSGRQRRGRSAGGNAGLNYYVYYRLSPEAVPDMRTKVRALFALVEEQFGIRGRWMRRRDDRNRMEVYEGNRDERAFDALLERFGATLGVQPPGSSGSFGGNSLLNAWYGWQLWLTRTISEKARTSASASRSRTARSTSRAPARSTGECRTGCAHLQSRVRPHRHACVRPRLLPGPDYGPGAHRSEYRSPDSLRRRADVHPRRAALGDPGRGDQRRGAAARAARASLPSFRAS